MLKDVDLNTIIDLIDTPRGYPTPPQEGALRFFDKEMRCLSSGSPNYKSSRACGSSTYMKIRGVPMCDIHALYELNRLLINAS